MPRSGAGARRRLQEAALALYRDHGYDATTTAQIAAAAGVTERTFFRHFADKREVFFDGEEELRRLWLDALAELPGDVAPLPALLAAAEATVPLLESNAPVVAQRRPVITATPALRERELAKAAHLVDALADALVGRGLAPLRALLAAQAGFAAISRATAGWFQQPGSDLREQLQRAFAELAQLAGEAASQDPLGIHMGGEGPSAGRGRVDAR